jgi:tetratricopeptide (TPR) repeat protein/transcriptional regulator with XRE-family HTH domain
MASVQPFSFGALLRRSRLATGLTQEELAARAGLSAKAISALECGARRAPRTATLTLLADALGLSEPERALLAAAARGRRLPSPAPQPGGASGGAGGDRRTLPPLVGRHHECALLEQHLVGLGPPCLLLVGEPGIGKSRLLDEAAVRARAQGWTVLGDRCHRRSGQDPYAPLVGALTRFLANRSLAQQRVDLQGCAWLVRLLPELVETAVVPAPSWQLPPAQERRLLFGAVVRFLANVAGPAGTLLILDDLQWAGDDALDLLAALVRAPSWAPPGSGGSLLPLRVVGAYRDTEVVPHDPLPLLLGDLTWEGVATQVSLAPLAREEARDLLAVLLAADAPAAGDPPTRSDLLDVVLDRSSGLPFFLVSWTWELRTTGPLSVEAARHAVPWSAAESIRQRVAVLPASAQAVLALAAVAGRETSRTLLLLASKASGQEEADFLGGLDAAVRARLLAERAEGAYAFAHDLVQETVLADLGGARRAVLHQRVAEALEGLSQPQSKRERRAVELAWHFSQADLPARALPHALQAGDQAEAVYAHAEAEQHYRLACALALELGDQARDAEALEKLGDVLLRMARYDDALEALEQAASLYGRAGDTEARGRVVAQVGWAHAGRGTGAAGVARLREELSAAPGFSAQGLARLHLALAQLHALDDSGEDVLLACGQAEELARAAGDHDLLVRALARRGVVLNERVGQVEEARTVLEEVVCLAEAAGDLWSLVRALVALGESYKVDGQYERAHQYYTRAITVAERLDDPTELAFAVAVRGDNACYAGAWQQARADLGRAEAVLRQVPVSWRIAYPLLGLGYQDLVEGHWEAAEHQLQEALAIADRSGDLQAQRVICCMLAERDLLERRPEVARARLERVLDLSDTMQTVTDALPLLAWAYLDLGDVKQAEDLVGDGLVRARPDNRRVTLVDLLRVQSLISIQRGEWLEAEEALEEALAMSRDIRYPYAQAKALYVHGLLAMAKGEPEQAREHFEQALAICAQLGERLYAEHSERALAELG